MTETSSPPPDVTAADVLQFAGADESRDKSNDVVPFCLVDDPDTVYTARRPKMAVLLGMVKVLADDTDQMAQVAAFDDLLDKILDADSVAALRDRLEDEEDELDLDSPGIENMFKTLLGLWYGRPIGKPVGSRRSPSRTGRRSTGRSRSRG